MKPTIIYNDKLVKNEDKFTDAFYSRFQLKPHTLELDDKIKKTYQFPTFYGDVTVAIGIFTCSYEKAYAMMPHKDMKPVILKPGKAIVIFSCYEYKNVLGIPPYNEIAMTIPIQVGAKINIPALPMIMSNAFKKFGYYVFSMPVTSLENNIRGHKIWGLPKVVEEIDIVTKDGNCVTTAYDEGKPYFELSVPMTGKPKLFDVRSNLYSRLDNELLQAETCFKGDFLVGKTYDASKGPCLKIFDTKSGNVLKALEIDEKPFQFRYAEHMTACFDLPKSDYKAPFKF